MQTSRHLGSARGVATPVSVFAGASSGAGATVPVALSAGVAGAFVAGTGFADLALPLIVVAVRPPHRDAGRAR